MNRTLDFHADYRFAARGGAVYLFVEAVLWLLSAVFGALGNVPVAIIILIFGGMLIHPIALGVSHLLRLPKLNERNDLPILNTWLALTIPLSLLLPSPFLCPFLNHPQSTIHYPRGPEGRSPQSGACPYQL